MRWFIQAASRLQTSVDLLKSMYTFTELSPATSTSGDTPYPLYDNSLEGYNEKKGMALELRYEHYFRIKVFITNLWICIRNVSFSYHADQKTTPALNDISFNISAGQLIVIVGANGSGKSTLIRILARLQEPSAGELLVDGRPAIQYRIDDLHAATALLSQENKIYPFSLGENIGLGYPDYIEDEEMILDAAKQGGASKLIGNLKDGLHALFDPCIELGFYNLLNKRSHPLYHEMKELQKEMDVSGGEKQKIVA